jgi:hypothetical protein
MDLHANLTWNARYLRSRAGLVAGILAAATLAAGCGSEGAPPAKSGVTHHASVDGPTFSSVQELAASSELYVRGVIGEVVSREADSGGAAPEIEDVTSVPVKFVGLQVTGSSDASQAAIGSVVPVVWLDFGTNVETDISDLAPGSEVLMFVKPMTPKMAPGIDTVDFFLAPTGGENGVFDVRGDEATARDQALTSLMSTGASATEEPLTARVAEILAAASGSLAG